MRLLSIAFLQHHFPELYFWFPVPRKPEQAGGDKIPWHLDKFGSKVLLWPPGWHALGCG
jgi:hypothetical protein